MLFPAKQLRYALYLFMAAINFTACSSETKQADKKPKDNPPTIVDVMIATSEPVTNLVEANGTVVANEFVELHPEVNGRLTYLQFPEGKLIQAGTVIARINDADLRAQMNKTKVQLSLAETTVSRYKQLLDVGGINQSDYDIAVNQVNGYKADIQYTQSLIDKTIIRAPFTGVAGLRQVSPGAYVTPATVIATLQQLSKVKVDFTLPEGYADIIKAGAMVDVVFDDNNDKKLKAEVIATEPGANTDTRNIKVRAMLQDTAVHPGSFAKVYIDEGRNKTAILVPTNAIIPDDRNNQLVVVKGGLANFVAVKTGNRYANNIEILSGIEPGDSIVVTGVLFARPKSKLKVRAVKKPDLLPAEAAQKN